MSRSYIERDEVDVIHLEHIVDERMMFRDDVLCTACGEAWPCQKARLSLTLMNMEWAIDKAIKALNHDAARLKGLCSMHGLGCGCIQCALNRHILDLQNVQEKYNAGS